LEASLTTVYSRIRQRRPSRAPCLCRCTLSIWMSFIRHQLLLSWVISCEIACQMTIAELLQTISVTSSSSDMQQYSPSSFETKNLRVCTELLLGCIYFCVSFSKCNVLLWLPETILVHGRWNLWKQLKKPKSGQTLNQMGPKYHNFQIHYNSNVIIEICLVYEQRGTEYAKTHSYNESQQDALFLKFIWWSTLHVSDMSTVHHQKYLKTVYRAIGICHTVTLTVC